MKKIFALLLVLCMAVALFVGCAPAEESGKLKLGVILIGDENEGYTYAHIKGIRDAIDALGKDKSTSSGSSTLTTKPTRPIPLPLTW